MSEATIGSALAEKRRQYGLEKGQAADKIGMSRTTYSSYEQDSQRPSVDVFPALAEFLDVSMDELLDLYGATCVAAVRPSLERLLSSRPDVSEVTEGAEETTTSTDEVPAVDVLQQPAATVARSSFESEPDQQSLPEATSYESESPETLTGNQPPAFVSEPAEEPWARSYTYHSEDCSEGGEEVPKPSTVSAEPPTFVAEADLAEEREVILFTSYDPLPSSITTVKAESREKETHHKKKKKKKKKN